MPSDATPSRALVPVSAATLVGDLAVPCAARAMVLLAQAGSAGQRCHRHVSIALARAGLATLLLDLLTQAEGVVDARTGHVRFDVPLLSTRLADATDWARAQSATAGLRLGYLGTSTAGAAALVAAAARPTTVSAVVSLGGPADLAAQVLDRVQAPTLLVVGGNDLAAIELNREALRRLHVESMLEVVPGAGHRFEYPRALATVAGLARHWFERHLALPSHA